MLRNGKQGFTVFRASYKIKVEEDETGKGLWELNRDWLKGLGSKLRVSEFEPNRKYQTVKT